MAPTVPRKKNGTFYPQGQTAAGLYGNDPFVAPFDKTVDEEPTHLEP